MKKFLISVAVTVLIVTSCYTLRSVPEYKDYSETIDISGMDAAIIEMKTKIWVQEQINKHRAYFVSGVTLLNESGTGDSNGYVSFHIEDEKCQFIFYRWYGNKFYGDNKKEASEKAFREMEKQKFLIAEYRAYITKPALSPVEIDALITKGDEAYDKNQFSQAAKYYNEALQSAPTDVYILIANGLSNERQSTRTERFVIDTNKIMSVFKEWTGSDKIDRDRWSTGYEWRYNSDKGYDDECSSLETAYKGDISNLDRAMDMFNTVLSIEPDNEIATSCVEYVKQRKAYINNRHSQISTALVNIKKSYEPIRDQLIAQQQAAEWARLTNQLAANLNQLAGNLAQVQQNQSGGYSGGGASGGGQGQAGTSGSSSSSSSHDRNNFDIARAKNSYQRDAKNAESAWENIKSSGDYSGQQRQTFQQCQTRMRRTREEAARNGHTINKSKWEDERLP
jgi:tetratricopeptide (TPR) repeat protein